MAVGIDATKIVLKDVEAVVTKLLSRAKDGIGVDDVFALVSDAEFRAHVTSLVANVKKVKEEATDLTLDEGVALIQPTAELVVNIVKAVKA